MDTAMDMWHHRGYIDELGCETCPYPENIWVLKKSFLNWDKNLKIFKIFMSQYSEKKSEQINQNISFW